MLSPADVVALIVCVPSPATEGTLGRTWNVPFRFVVVPVRRTWSKLTVTPTLVGKLEPPTDTRAPARTLREHWRRAAPYGAEAPSVAKGTTSDTLRMVTEPTTTSNCRPEHLPNLVKTVAMARVLPSARSPTHFRA